MANIFTNQHRLLPGKLYDERKFEEINEMILGRKKISEQEPPVSDNLRVSQDKLDRFNFCQKQL